MSGRGVSFDGGHCIQGIRNELGVGGADDEEATMPSTMLDGASTGPARARAEAAGSVGSWVAASTAVQ